MYSNFNSQHTSDKPVCICKVCKRPATKIDEYIRLAKDLDYKSVDECVANEEGTYNPETGYFYCTECYIKVGQPLGTA